MALFANNVLAWQQVAAQNVQRALPFHLDSYNSGRPYSIAIVAPKHETIDADASLYFAPKVIRQLLRDGCMAADAMMHDRYGLASMANECARRFPKTVSGASGAQVELNCK